PGLSGYPRPVRENEVLKPSLIIAIGDAAIFNIIYDEYNAVVFGYSDLPGFGFVDYAAEAGLMVQLKPPVAFIRRRHNGRWNMVFCDGHVQALRTKGFFNYRDDAVLRLWNNDNL